VSVGQIAGNLGSILGGAADPDEEGTRSFRLYWWGSIVNYTVFGPYFWTGKGYGINLADADGFQPTADHSLRAPHNSSLSFLARSGVPGFVLWVLFLAAYAVALIRAWLRARKAGDRLLETVGVWLMVYLVAILVDTSFDPYLEGPQGGIWWWTLIGVGLVVMRLTSPEPQQSLLPRLRLPGRRPAAPVAMSTGPEVRPGRPADAPPAALGPLEVRA
jgi:hypothetical protein